MPFRRAALAAIAILSAVLAGPRAHAENNLRTSAQAIDTTVTTKPLVFDLMANETVMAVNVTGLTASGATITIEGSSDARAVSDSAKTWFAVPALPFSCPASSAPFSTLTADKPFKLDVTGLTNVRFRISATGTGNAIIGLNAVPAATMISCGQLVSDPCVGAAKTFAPINLTASGQIITGTAANKTYICSLALISGAAQGAALVEGTGSACATGITGMSGGTTAPTGWQFAANGGLSVPGPGTQFKTATAADNVCLILGGGQVSGTVGYVVAP